MKRVFRHRKFECFYDRDSHAQMDALEFDSCEFESCAVSITKDPAKRTTVRNVLLRNCSVRGCALEAAIVEDVLVDGLRTYGLFQCWAPVFKHVTLRGRIGQVMISPAVQTGTATPEVQHAFAEANAAYYRSVDWALDVSAGEFIECELQGVPADLVRRDPETQVIVRRYKALGNTWLDLDLSKTYWKTSLEFFLNRGEPDIVLVAGKRDPKFRELVAGLNLLRKAGVADPD